ncbi:MAG: iron ABC transporter substrate-binding protein [Desulfomonilaceae bacterium]|jgi:iron complex transport system substrate-binding protein
MKKILEFFLVPALVIVIAANLEASNGKTVTVTDMGKRSVTVPLAPKRIICLSSGTLRLICYLQATDRVVGVEDFEKTRPYARPYIIANAELTKLPRIGPGGPGSINKEPDLEAVLNVKPDVIFISYMEPRNADELQKKLDIPVVILTHGRFASFDELVYGSLRVAGKILNKEKRAEEVIDFVENKRLDLASRSKGFDGSQKPSVYVGAVGYKGVQGIESSDASFTPMEWVRARNIAKDISKGEHLFIDKEKLLSLNPSVIFIDGGGLNLVKQDFEKRPEFYKGLRAFKDNKVYALYPFNYYTTNVDTAIADAYTVGKVLYPEKFADVSLPDKADEIYKFLVGKPVYKEMEKDFGPLGRVVDFGM